MNILLISMQKVYDFEENRLNQKGHHPTKLTNHQDQAKKLK